MEEPVVYGIHLSSVSVLSVDANQNIDQICTVYKIYIIYFIYSTRMFIYKHSL